MKRVHLISAVSENNGIGFKGSLPWRLKKEMEYFTKMTSITENGNCRNAVIMGRKTWESIPNKYRPLADRLNVVISKQMIIRNDEVKCFSSVVDAVKALRGCDFENIETIWIIGGYSIYKEALDKHLCDKLFLTRIKRDFECDVFFPEFSKDRYQLVEDERVSTELQSENGIEYYFQVYEKQN